MSKGHKIKTALISITERPDLGPDEETINLVWVTDDGGSTGSANFSSVEDACDFLESQVASGKRRAAKK